MTSSMTAYANVQKQLDAGILCWEIKSVNHRYLDVSFRLPEAFRALETSVRPLLRTQLNRGKLECQLKFLEQTAKEQALVINNGLIDTLLDMANQLASLKQIENDLSVTTLLTWPNVIQTKEPDLHFLAEEAKLLFEEALQQLQAVRKNEGLALRGFLQNHLAKLALEVQAVKENLAQSKGQYREKLLKRLENLQLTVDPLRIEQEIALILTKADVNEELERLELHISEVAKVLIHDEASGRRLDFLMQELNREVNTLGSKIDSVALTQRVVEMKVLIEQMREQIQNIE